MSHLHSSSGCLCCSAMGVNFIPLGELKSQEVSSFDRLSTAGLDHVYIAAEDAIQVEILEQEYLSEPEPAENEQLQALQAVIQDQQLRIDDQTRRLESASYRLGYLEAQLSAKDEQLKLLTEKPEKNSWWSRLQKWFVQ